MSLHVLSSPGSAVFSSVVQINLFSTVKICMICNSLSLLWASVSPSVHTRQDWIIFGKLLARLGVEPSGCNVSWGWGGVLRGEC